MMFRLCCEKSNYKMSKTQSVILRVTIVLGMMVAVVAVLYFSPLPEQEYESCDRPCNDKDWPMICRMKIHVETVLDASNSTQILLNRLNTGPDIQVCQNDILVIDIVNKIPGHTLSIHWRGQPNIEAPYMDGAPLITQCPILSYTTFQYKFRASAPGTHLYHAHSDHDRSRGVFGALIVRQPETYDSLRKYYDIDAKKSLMIMSTSSGELLINGKGANITESIFNVIKNKRYRFRVGYAGGASDCPITLQIDRHVMKIISLDGGPIKPIEADSVVLNKGERVDFVVKTNQSPNGYFMKVGSCHRDGLALLNYEGPVEEFVEQQVKDGRIFDSGVCETGIGRVCLGDVKALFGIPSELRAVHKMVYLAFGSKILVNDEYSSRQYFVNNITFTYPPAPLLTQLGEISPSSLCSSLDVPAKCQDLEICECVHVEHIPLGSSAELVLVNQDESSEEHVFHLHGFRFYVVGARHFDSGFSLEQVKYMDEKEELFERNFNHPVMKDTVRVPKNAVVAVRFLANNPGFWMLRDENSKGWTRGLDVVLQVGDMGDFPSIPSDFPKCGNFIGPDFFFM